VSYILIINKFLEQMNKSFATIATLAALAGSTEGKWSRGGCGKVENMDNFDAAQYSGKWYE